jgi:TPR repeat protein
MTPYSPSRKARLLAVFLSLAIVAPIALETPAEATPRGYRWLQQKVKKRKKTEALERHRAEIQANRKKRLAASAARAAAAKIRTTKRKPWMATPKMREIRGRMLKGRDVTVPELRLLADAGDSLAAYKIGKKLQDANDPKLLEQAVDYYARAAAAGRVSALKPLSKILKSRGAALPRQGIKSAEKAMVLRAKSGSAFAAETLASFYQSGEPFGKKPADAAAMLRRSIKSGNGQSAIDLALLLMTQGPLDIKTKTEVTAYLKVSHPSDSPETRAVTQALIHRLDRPQPTSPELTQ